MRTTFLCVTWRASSSSRLKRRSMSARGDRIRGDLRPNDLDRDRHAQFRVPGLVDRAHAADAEDLDDVVPRPERLTDFQRSGPGLAAGKPACPGCPAAIGWAATRGGGWGKQSGGALGRRQKGRVDVVGPRRRVTCVPRLVTGSTERLVTGSGGRLVTASKERLVTGSRGRLVTASRGRLVTGSGEMGATTVAARMVTSPSPSGAGGGGVSTPAATAVLRSVGRPHEGQAVCVGLVSVPQWAQTMVNR